MKVLSCAVLAAFLLAVPAAAQQTTPTPATPPATALPTTCPALPPQPTLPDGATAERPAMDAGNTAFIAWSEAYRQGVVCRRGETEQLHATWQARIAEHNQAAVQLNEAIAAWEAEAAEFNARRPDQRARSRRSSN